MTRTYKIRWNGGERKDVTRQLPCDHQEARDAAMGIAGLNPAWHGTTWEAKDGDAFSIDETGSFGELTAEGGSE